MRQKHMFSKIFVFIVHLLHGYHCLLELFEFVLSAEVH